MARSRLPKPARPIRLVFAIIFGLFLSLGLGLQAASLVVTKKAPELALNLFPLNGLAKERLAFQNFTLALSTDPVPEAAAQVARAEALSAYFSDPLAPKALAILALSQTDDFKRKRIIEMATSLDRRDTTMQGVLLSERVASEDYQGVIEVLDRLLRVNPERSTELFPLLTTAFVQDGGVEEFGRLLGGDTPWRDRFLTYAVRQPEALENLARLRSRYNFSNERFEKALVRNLATRGDLEESARIYELVTGRSLSASARTELDWKSEFVPFDWYLVDKAGFRAQPSLDSAKLEINVRPGNGGIIASRVTRVPQGPFEVHVDHRISPAALAEDVKLNVICIKDPTILYESEFKREDFAIAIDDFPEDCAFASVTIEARAWSGRAALRGEIEAIKIIGSGGEL